MNEDDSDQISSILLQMGYAPTQDLQQSDIIMLNTCSVRAKPEQKVRTKLGLLRELKEANPELIIGVCGCMAQRQGEAIRMRQPHVDLIVGTAQIQRIPELIAEVKRNRRPISALELPRSATDAAVLPGRLATHSGTALKSFVPIMYGCDNFCAYCIVPYVRGKERSRPMTEIVEEVQRLADGGCKDITLVGQNVNSYAGSDENSHTFADLLTTLNDVPGIERIRFMTSHPKDLSDQLIEAIVTLDKVCEHIHLPMQSGDSAVLARMRRGYSAETYRERVNALRKARPKIALTTDILVGFPGETDAEFENTVHAIEEIRFDAAFMFAFSAIERTVAASMPDQLPLSLKNGRLGRVIELQNSITIDINRQSVGDIFEVLVEGKSPKNPARLTGLTRHNKTMNFNGPERLIGELTMVRAIVGQIYGCVGELTD